MSERSIFRTWLGLWPWWLRWHELLCSAASSSSQRFLPGLPGVEGWHPAWSKYLSLLRTLAAPMQFSSDSFLLQCGVGCSHSRKVGRWRVTCYNIQLEPATSIISLVLFQTFKKMKAHLSSWNTSTAIISTWTMKALCYMEETPKKKTTLMSKVLFINKIPTFAVEWGVAPLSNRNRATSWLS